jgi:hypothetical protein
VGISTTTSGLETALGSVISALVGTGDGVGGRGVGSDWPDVVGVGLAATAGSDPELDVVTVVTGLEHATTKMAQNKITTKDQNRCLNFRV